MLEEQFIKISRELLYNEIWEISLSGVTKKYNIPYGQLRRLCKEIEVPTPPSGHWVKLSFGKQVEKNPLPKSQHNEVILHINIDPKDSNISSASETIGELKVVKNQSEKTDNALEATVRNEYDEEQSEDEATNENDNSHLSNRIVSAGRNVYDREKLYEEVWSKPVVQVALKYGVSDVAIHKVCKSLNVPVPPRGYWAKVRAGRIIKKSDLPSTKGISEKTGAKTFEGITVSNTPQQKLAFLTEDERQKVLLKAEQTHVSDGNMKLHNKIKAYQSKVKEWNKNDWKSEGAKRSNKNYSDHPPFLAGVISNETLPRVYRILDALYRQVEILGGSVNDDLSLTVRNEHIDLEISEAQDKVKHEITREEAQKLIIYEDAKRYNTWASQPNIRKYDYVFNEKLRICIRQRVYFRDSEKKKVESRLRDMLIELYEESEVVRKNREAYEEEQQRKKEEEKRREERKIRYNEEVDKTNALTNMAQDYDLACRIRAYINAFELKVNTNYEKNAEFIDWAKKKADWFDPIVARTDELLGDREHERKSDKKALEKIGWYW